VIPLVDLKAQYRELKTELDAAVLSTLASTQYALGAAVDRFEHEFAAYCGTRHCVGVNSGASALHLALLAAGVGPQDEVVTVPFTFVATVAAIEYTGATPILVDIDDRYFTIAIDQVEQAITPRTKAIIPVHLYGQPADMTPLLDVARRHNLVVIEDAAQSHGAHYHGARVGGLGDIGCFSFYPSKNLGAAGDAGAVVTNSDEIAARIRALRDWGQVRKYEHVLKGFNYRMAGIQGAVLSVKLRHLDRWTAERQTIAGLYNRELQGADVILPPVRPGAEHVYHLYVVRSAARDRLRQMLGEREVATGVHYPDPVHLMPAFANLGYRAGAFPVAERASREVMSLPLYPEMTRDQVDTVSNAVREAVAESSAKPARS
jgi:dTDP-4-amino-4,6-dideoxygalactose transaminase